MYIIGHRGCKGKYNENTIECFQEAIEKGVDRIELDIIFQNGEIYVTHDAISTLTLETVFKKIKFPLLLDIKGEYDTDYIMCLYTLIIMYDVDVWFSSFNEIILKDLKHQLPKIKNGLITENILINLDVFKNYDFISLASTHLDDYYITKLNNINIEVYLWTINEKIENKYIDGIITDYPEKFI